MKKTRKLFAGLTALCCMGTLLMAFPAQAELVPWTVRVSLINYDEQNQPERYLLTEFRNWTYVISAEEMKTYLAEDSEMPVVGDVIQVMCPLGVSMDDSMMYQFHFDEEASITNRGNEQDFFTEKKDYIVTKHSGDMDGGCWTRLTDPETGDNYLYADYDYLYDSVYALDEVSVGDTVTCAVKDGNAAQVLTVTEGDGTLPEIPVPSREDNIPETPVIFMGQSETGYRMPGYYTVSTDGIYGEWGKLSASDVFLVTDETEFPQYGDVYYTDNYCVFETYPAQYAFYSKLKKAGTVEELYPVKEMTVTSNQTDTSELFLEDSDGTAYYYYYDIYQFSSWKFETPIQSLQPGDTVRCAYQESGDKVRILLITDINTKSELTAKPIETVSASGDADGSGKLDILDVVIVNKAILGKEEISPDRISYIDFNGNGKPDAEDTLIMMKKIVGLL